MNRIQLLDQIPELVHPHEKSSHRRKLKTGGSSSLRQQSFFVPMHYEPNYAYPLLVWLHGPGDGHQQLKRVMPHISVRNYVGVAPAPAEACDADAQFAENPWRQQEAGIAAALERVDESIAQATTRFHIARRRVFIAGFDCGGTMALRLAMAAPEMFAGVASLGGPFPQGNQPLMNLLAARRLPVLISHGRDSESYPIHRVCDELRLFHAAGMSLNLRQYPCGHELTTQMLSDLDIWMMEIVTGDSASATATHPRLPTDELN
jgi:phospholipase/carboxylesterase